MTEERVEVTMVEEVRYDWSFTREELAELLDLHPGTTADCLAAIVRGDWETAESVGLSSEVFDACQERLDGPLLDRVMEHFTDVHERYWKAREVLRKDA